MERFWSHFALFILKMPQTSARPPSQKTLCMDFYQGKGIVHQSQDGGYTFGKAGQLLRSQHIIQQHTIPYATSVGAWNPLSTAQNKTSPNNWCHNNYPHVWVFP